jgi:hypothetical protein
MRYFVWFFVAFAGLLADSCMAQTVVSPVNYNTTGSQYTQNFDGLPASGTYTLSGKGPFNLGGSPINATNLTGWQVLMTAGSNTNAAFAVGTGSSTGNGVYSLGAAASSDRALGSLSSSTGIYAMGMVLTNQTGNLLNSFTVSFTAEQWRKGGSSNKNTWSFHYKTGIITHLDQTGMQDEQNLNFSSVVTTASATSLNGNLPENRQTVSYTVTGISWKAGEQLLLRWDDADETGSDDAVGIDNFSFSAVLNSSAPSIINQSVITVTANSAQLSATVNDNYAGTSVLFEYDTVNTFSKAISIQPVPDTILAGSGNTNVLANFSGLLSGTNYYFRIKAKNTNGLASSATQGFITKVSLPSVSTIAAVNVFTGSAILGGNISSEGGAAVTERGIVWSAATTPTLLNNKMLIGSGPGNFSQTVSGLPEGSILYVRAYAINSAGVSYGDTVRLVTQTEINFLNTVTFGKINIATASFTFKTAQPVTGLSAQNFSLTTTGVSNALITSISGAENAFTITVNTGSGDGTLGLNFVNDIGLSIPVYNKPFSSANNYVVDKSPPQINRISIPNTPMKTGDTVPVSILVKPDRDIYKFITGNINGLGLYGFIKNNDSTYAAYFVIANGGNDVDASADIPLTVVLTDSIGNNSLPYTQAISQSSDAIDANKPVVVSIQNPPNGIYKAGDTLYFLIRFSEKIVVTPTGIPSITVTIGTRSRTAIYQTGSGSDSLLFRYIISNGDKDIDGIKTAGTITLNGAAIKDPIGNIAVVSFNNTLATKQILIDAVLPVVNSVTVPLAGIYKTGNVLDFIINFSKKVWVDETGLAPSLSIAIGSMQKVAQYINGTGSNTLLFRYIIQTDDRGPDGIKLISPLMDSNLVIRDSVGNKALLTLNSIGSMTSVQINPPTILLNRVIVPEEGIYKTGDTLEILVDYTERVFVSGVPYVKLTIGNSSKQAVYTNGSGSHTLSFMYIVQPGDEDIDGIRLSSSITVSNGSIRDDQSNFAPVILNNTGDLSRVLVDAVAADIKTVILPKSGLYKSGDTLDFIFRFTEKIKTGATIKSSTLSLTIGTKTVMANCTGYNSSDSLVFRYIIQNGDFDKDGIRMASFINYNNTVISDLAGNRSTSTFTATSAKNILIDAVAPFIKTVSLPSAGTYTTGASLDFIVSYSENVFVPSGTNLPFIFINLRDSIRKVFYTGGSGTNSLLFRYNIQKEDRDSAGAIRLVAPSNDLYSLVKDSAGNRSLQGFTSIEKSSGFHINPPIIITEQVMVPVQGIYKKDDTLKFSIQYAEKVFVDPKDGIPTLKILIGNSEKKAAYTGGSGSKILTFIYPIQSADEDKDGIEINPSTSFINADIKDAEGNPALTYLNNIGNTKEIIIDAVVPVIKSIILPGDRTYKENDTLLFTVKFTEKIRAISALNTATISLTIGTKVKTAIYAGGNGTDSLLFRYIIQAGELDKDGIKMISPVNLNGTSIQDSAGNIGSAAFTLQSTKNILIDAIAPIVSGVLVPVTGIYQTGNSLDFTVIFSKKVFVLAGDRFPFLAISLAKKTVNAIYLNGSGTNNLLFRYTIQSDDRDSLGIRLATALTDFDSLIRDTAGNKAITLLYNTGITSGIVINPPFIRINKVTTPLAALYKTGDTLNYFIGYNQNVFVSTKEGTPYLKINIGFFLKQAVYISGSGSNILLFRYIIQAGDEDKDGIEIYPDLLLNNGTIKDADGNIALTNLNNMADTKGIFIDGIAPSIKSITVPPGNTYKEGDTLQFILKFTEKIQATPLINTAAISLTIGTKTQTAIYAIGNGTDSLVFRYIIQTGELDKDGIKLASPLMLNVATIQDIAGNIGSGVFNPPATKNILIDAIAPVVIGMTVPSTGTYKTGNSLDFSVSFSKKIWINTNSGNPFLSVSIGSKSVKAFYANGSGTNTILFRYTIKSDDIDTDGLIVNPLINDANRSITDSAGNRANNVLNSIGAMTAIYINPPETNVVGVTVPKNGLYKTGDTLLFKIAFSGKASLSSTAVKPLIRMDIGTALKTAQYINGSGTNTWIFIYVIQPGDESINGIQLASSISLNTGSIKDEWGNNVSVVLPGNGNTGGILIDAISPVITNLLATEKHNYKAGDTLGLMATFSEPVYVSPKSDLPYVKLTIGNIPRNMVYCAGTGSNQYTFRYIIQPGDLDKNGIGIGSIIVTNNNWITDLAGNAAVLTFKIPNLFSVYQIDAVSPAFAFGNTETIDICENNPAISISKLLMVTDTEAGEQLTWDITNNPGHGNLSIKTITANSNGKNLTPAAINYKSFANQSGIDTILVSISDGINTSQKSILINIQPALRNNEISSPQTICFNYIPAILNGSVPTGGNGNYQYSWESSAISASSGFSNINGADTYAYLPTSLNNTTWFRRNTVSGACYDTSEPVKITVVKTGLWLGSSNNNWHDKNNWCGNNIPTNTTEVLINPNTLYEPIIRDTARCNHLTFTAKTHLGISGILQVSGEIKGEKSIQAEKGTLVFNGISEQKINGNVFENRTVNNIIINNPSGVSITDSTNLTGTLLLNAGTLFTNDQLTLKHTASIGPAALGTTVSGNIFIEHLIKGGRRVFWLQGHPFADTLGLQMLKDSIDITGNNGSLNGFTPTLTNQPSAFWYDVYSGNDSTGIEAGWTPFTNTNGLTDNIWERHKGIKVLVRGKPGQGLDGTPAGDGKNGTYLPQPVIIKLSGKINTGDQELNLQKDKYARYHVVGNPYAANIDLSNITKGKDIATNYWLWNPQQGINGGYTSFPFRSKNIIAPFGAFIAKATGSNYNKLFFTENCKTAVPVSDSIATVNLDDIFYVELRLESDSILWDRIVLLAMDSAKIFVDKNDAEKFMNNDVNFYSLSKENKLLSIDARPVNNESTINLGIQTEEPRIFRIRVAKSALPPSNTLKLHDKYLDKWTELLQDSSYLFYTTNDTSTQGNERFEIASRKKLADTPLLKPAMIAKVNPIPARDKIVVNYAAAEPGITSIRLLSLSGMPLKTISLGIQKQGQVTIPVGDLLRGIYLLELKCGSETRTQKIIKD